ncbi:Vesicular glutamate transporter 1, partial [Gryllus bimaculatus]
QLLARWAPPTERSRLYAVIGSGINVGNVITLPVSGLIATHWGWPSAFYCAGVLWWLLWWTQIADSPEIDRRVSLTERVYIKEKIGTATVCSKVISHPWRKILTSPPYLARVVAMFCADWAFYTVQTEIPMYLEDTLGYNLQGAGFVSALPFVAMGCFQLVAGYLADLLEGRNLLHTTTVRKLYVCGGFMMLVLCLLLSTYLTDPSSIVACISFGTAFTSFVYTASSVNILDMAPLHASVLEGLSNTITNLSGMLTSQITGFIVQTQFLYS